MVPTEPRKSEKLAPAHKNKIPYSLAVVQDNKPSCSTTNQCQLTCINTHQTVHNSQVIVASATTAPPQRHVKTAPPIQHKKLRKELASRSYILCTQPQNKRSFAHFPQRPHHKWSFAHFPPWTPPRNQERGRVQHQADTHQLDVAIEFPLFSCSQGGTSENII